MSESEDTESTPPTVTMEQLGDLRAKTEAVAQSLREHLTSIIQTLRPLVAPAGRLGEHVRGGSHEVAVHGDK